MLCGKMVGKQYTCLEQLLTILKKWSQTLTSYYVWKSVPSRLKIKKKNSERFFLLFFSFFKGAYFYELKAGKEFLRLKTLTIKISINLTTLKMLNISRDFYLLIYPPQEAKNTKHRIGEDICSTHVLVTYCCVINYPKTSQLKTSIDLRVPVGQESGNSLAGWL